jgi:hypothetical protein
MKFHPVANIFPMMSAEEFAALKADIDANGQREPIWTHQDQIVDGRNRYNACTDLGIAPRFREWDGNDEEQLLWFVVSLNEKRRHLNSSQKAVVALNIEAHLAKIAEQRKGGRPIESYTANKEVSSSKPGQIFAPVSADKSFKTNNSGKAAVQAAAAVGSNSTYVKDAKKLQEKAPDLLEKVHNGKMRIPEAKREMKARASAEIRTQAAAEIKQANSNIIIGDFWANANNVPDNSLSLIFTDPPYDKAAEASIAHLADFAARKLAPGGSVLFYLGHLQLPAAFKAFDGKLRHWWTCACVHAGSMAVMNYYGVRVGWKPMLWFVKESRFDTQNIVVDTVSSGTEKTHHDWQQAESEASYWIEKLCPADGIVCDPFLGGGTTAAAAIKLNRKWIGFEIDPDTARIASGRLEGK